MAPSSARFSALRHRNFRLIWTGQIVSNISRIYTSLMSRNLSESPADAAWESIHGDKVYLDTIHLCLEIDVRNIIENCCLDLKCNDHSVLRV